MNTLTSVGFASAIVLTGKAGGALQTGRVLNYMDKGNDGRRACSLYLSLMDKMGVQLDRFGDTSQRLRDGGREPHVLLEVAKPGREVG